MQNWAKGLRTLGGFHRQRGGRLDKTGATPVLAWKRGCGQTTDVGAYANQRLNLAEEGKAHNRNAKVSNLGNLAVRDYRGASGNAAMVELCTHLAIGRARLVTSHLKLVRPISIPTTEIPEAYWRRHLRRREGDQEPARLRHRPGQPAGVWRGRCAGEYAVADGGGGEDQDRVEKNSR